MAGKSPKQIALAQHFLRNPGLVRSLLDESSIEPCDIVYEIGPGGGVITAELARIAYKVIAIEKDPVLAARLRRRFLGIDSVEVIRRDFLDYHIPHMDYKIFANIPYNVTAEIVRKILHVPPVPSEAYLVMQKEAAEKFSGNPCETRFSILAKPFFDLEIVCELRRTDFDPIPRVDSVLLHIKKRSIALIRKEDEFSYRCFIRYGFGRWRKNLRLIFKPVFSHHQWIRLSRDLHLPLNVTPTQVSFEQWLGLFECFRQRVSFDRQAIVRR